MGGKAKRQALLGAEQRVWHTRYQIPEVLEVLRAASGATGRGKLDGEIVSRGPDHVRMGWSLGPSFVYVMWIVVLLTRREGVTTVQLDVARANFRRSWPLPWTLSGADKLHKFQDAIGQLLPVP